MTIRFSFFPSFVYSSMIFGMILSCNQSYAIAINCPEKCSSLSRTPLSNNSIVSSSTSLLVLQIPFLSNSKKKKPVETIDTINKEYIFRAPQTTSQKQNTIYQVQVYGNSSNLLEKVQAIEPKAFLKGNLIQVGVFSEQKNAEYLLQKLALQGFWARIIINN